MAIYGYRSTSSKVKFINTSKLADKITQGIFVFVIGVLAVYGLFELVLL